MSNDDDALSSALSTRRMVHGRGRNKACGSKNPGGAMFDPTRAVGFYEIEFGARKTKSAAASHLIIHGFTSGETGLFASIRIGNILAGLAVLAGSRKGVKEIVEQLEEGDQSEEEEEEDEDVQAGAEARKTEDRRNEDQNDEGKIDEDSGGTSGFEGSYPRSAMEEEDDRINRRAKAFEKNSFRNPKFWMCWTANVKASYDTGAVFETNMGYIVFSGNSCSAFEGTISSKEMDWNNVKIKGNKIKSKVSECNQKWTEFSRNITRT